MHKAKHYSVKSLQFGKTLADSNSNSSTKAVVMGTTATSNRNVKAPGTMYSHYNLPRKPHPPTLLFTLPWSPGPNSLSSHSPYIKNISPLKKKVGAQTLSLWDTHTYMSMGGPVLEQQ